jgi:hypothetical protein
MAEANVLVPNTGTAQVETTAIPQPDGTISYRQRADVGEGFEVPEIRALLESIYLEIADARDRAFNMRAFTFDGPGNLEVSDNVSISGGANVFRLIAAASTNASLVKGGMGQVYGWYLFNAAAATRFVKLYNKASPPSVGTDLPWMTIGIPAGAAANVWNGAGISFPLGIALATTVSMADSASDAVTASDLAVNIWYA